MSPIERIVSLLSEALTSLKRSEHDLSSAIRHTVTNLDPIPTFLLRPGVGAQSYLANAYTEVDKVKGILRTISRFDDTSLVITRTILEVCHATLVLGLDNLVRALSLTGTLRQPSDQFCVDELVRTLTRSFESGIGALRTIGEASEILAEVKISPR